MLWILWIFSIPAYILVGVYFISAVESKSGFAKILHIVTWPLVFFALLMARIVR